MLQHPNNTYRVRNGVKRERQRGSEIPASRHEPAAAFPETPAPVHQKEKIRIRAEHNQH
jgi:hypothetical protein